MIPKGGHETQNEPVLQDQSTLYRGRIGPRTLTIIVAYAGAC